jgi:hypothetical protein
MAENEERCIRTADARNCFRVGPAGRADTISLN